MHERKSGQTASLSEWQAFRAENPDIQFIDAFIIDINGNTAGKRLPAADADKLYGDGAMFSACALIADCRGMGHNAGGLGKSDGDPDGIARPMPGYLRRVPWTSVPTAQAVCHMVTLAEGANLWFDPRMILADVLAQCRAAGIHPVVACELEFYLIDPRRAADGRISVGSLPGRSAPRRAGNLSLEVVEDLGEFLKRVDAAALAQQLPVCGSVAEYGISQFEVNLRHVADPLLAADQAVLLKRLVRGVARSLGMDATFMAKPFASQPGSGLHVHVSIVDEQGRNRFGASGGDALLRHGVAGMQALMYDSMAFYAPNFNAQRRYLGKFVPTTRDWGHNNRSVAFRIPPGDGEATRIEHRVAGADASPHLTMAAILAALLHGIGNRLEPGAPVEGRAAEGGDHEFPGDLMVALNRLEHSELLAKYLPRRFLEIYGEVKRGEYGDLIEEVFSREHDFYA
ncbi:MAG: glutamine synthetase [Gammaproteobacteria bacterium]|nr:glutamine synthetase [Gammaproteobacteria bacterium]